MYKQTSGNCHTERDNPLGSRGGDGVRSGKCKSSEPEFMVRLGVSQGLAKTWRVRFPQEAAT